MEIPLPPEQNNPSTWYGPDWIGREDEWIIPFSPQEITELEAAAEQWDAAHKSGNIETIIVRDFKLPTLAPKLLGLREELIHGRGFALLRGLPTANYTEREAAIVFCGLGSHLGLARPQNAQGHLLGQVRDMGMTSRDPNVRVYQTKERQTFHTDSTDVVGLLCLSTAKFGGLSLLVSSSTIFNEMHKRRPDLLQLLMGPIATDRRGEIPKGMLPYYSIPVFNYYEGYLSAIYQRQYIDSAQRFPDAPRLTPEHTEALNLFDELANSPELNFSMKLEKGDMQFVYNHTLLHDRTAFEDWPEQAQKRHLLRLWLSIPGDRPLPEIFAEKFGSVEIGNRGGIVVEK
ncbi:MAG TPA: TauD/TfdA family dioxygenase [Candidatus Kapabacteria bacterium]|nr:TauD/TfdA family dioxygenase [Candidatus Kapabacteria bacterium]